jgi:hypothetical protein
LQNNKQPNFKELKNYRDPVNMKDLKRIFYQCWTLETCHPMFLEEWEPHNPAIGQNDVTALSIRVIFGGELMVCERDDTMRYFWNILPSEQKIDLTLWPHKLKKAQEKNSKPVSVNEIIPIGLERDVYFVYRRYVTLYLKVLKLI